MRACRAAGMLAAGQLPVQVFGVRVGAQGLDRFSATHFLAIER
jgi:hypothetical protein